MTKSVLGERLYTIPEVAEMLGVSTRSITAYIQKKKLQGQKIGKRWYFAEANVKDFIHGRKPQQ